jgi:hypothetical protein
MMTPSRLSNCVLALCVAALLQQGTYARPAAAPHLTVAAREPLATEALIFRAPCRRRKSAANVQMLLRGGSAGASKAATASSQKSTKRLLGLSPRALEGLKNGVASGLATVHAACLFHVQNTKKYLATFKDSTVLQPGCVISSPVFASLLLPIKPQH